MLQFDLNADVRTKFGKGASRSLRRAGKTPAVLYGPKTDPLSLTLDAKSLTKTLIGLQRRNAVFNMEINDGSSSNKRSVILKEIQAAPISGDLLHADFLEVQLEQPMTFEVPVHYNGNAKGVELGGEMHIALRSVSLQGLILDIPDSIDIDVTALNIGDKLHCSDLTIPAGIEILNDQDATCVAVTSASREPVEEEAEETAEEAPAAAEEGGEEESA